MSASDIDPITFSVIWGGLISAAAEMGVTMTRTAYSVAVREGSDFSTGVFDAEGNMVAQGDYSPGHLGSMAFVVRRMLEDYPSNTLHPGDAIISNDPRIGSGHLPDVYMMSPVFLEGRLLGFAVNIAHQIDTGGAGAGSQTITGIRENYQEGIRFLPHASVSQRRAGAGYIPVDRRQRPHIRCTGRHASPIQRERDWRPSHARAYPRLRRGHAAGGHARDYRAQRNRDAGGAACPEAGNLRIRRPSRRRRTGKRIRSLPMSP